MLAVSGHVMTRLAVHSILFPHLGPWPFHLVTHEAGFRDWRWFHLVISLRSILQRRLQASLSNFVLRPTFGRKMALKNIEINSSIPQFLSQLCKMEILDFLAAGNSFTTNRFFPFPLGDIKSSSIANVAHCCYSCLSRTYLHRLVGLAFFALLSTALASSGVSRRARASHSSTGRRMTLAA